MWIQEQIRLAQGFITRKSLILETKQLRQVMLVAGGRDVIKRLRDLPAAASVDPSCPFGNFNRCVGCEEDDVVQRHER